MVPTDSMENGIMAGDRLLVRKTETSGRGDVIVFNHPDRTDVQLVKRCIGLQGDTVHMIRGAPYINGRAIEAIPTTRKCREIFHWISHYAASTRTPTTTGRW